MTALVAAGKHPEIWAAIVAWVPVPDLVDWYEFNKDYPHRKFNDQIMAAWGGEPLPGTKAEQKCKKRSPSTYLSQPSGKPIFLAHGLKDPLVPAYHSKRAFNMLARPADRLKAQQMDYIVKEKALPPALKGTAKSPFFRDEDPNVLFTRESGNVKLVLFEGVHDMAYNPGLLWLSEKQRK